MNLSLKIDNDKNTAKTQPMNTNPLDHEKKNGLSFLRNGQQITGTVIAVAEQVVLDLCGQKVTASKEILGEVIPGDQKTFNVTKAAGDVIELMLVRDSAEKEQQMVTTIMRLDKDQDNFLSLIERKNKNTEKEKDVNHIKNRMDEVVSKMTEQDYKMLEEKGIPVDQLSMEQLCVELNRVKSEEKAKLENPIYLIQTEATDKQIAARLAAENLPVTKEAIKKVANALHLSHTVSQMDDYAVKNLIANEEKPTIANIYKACYSGDAKVQSTEKKLSPQAWEELKSQVEEVIAESGYEINQKNVEDAKWLVENDLPLTKETFTYKKELDEIKENLSKEQILDCIIKDMKRGIAPLDATLHSNTEISFEQLMEDIHSISQETIAKAVQSNETLSIKNLAALEKNYADDRMRQNITENDISLETTNPEEIETLKKDYTLEQIKAQRQLEEIRLKMTKEAAARLESKGFHIETEHLEKVVDALRELEDSYYRDLLVAADAGATQSNIELLKETAQSIEQLKQSPVHILGTTLSKYRTITLTELAFEGNHLQNKFAQAGEAYETLMTVPNREYGDSIQKAFKNMDSLLAELGIENTEANKRAVRILGYNQMEITEENIAKVKAYDLEVMTMVRNLHPGVTVTMIKEGINPLQIPIHELNQIIDRIRNEQGITSDEKFSTYLRKLEKMGSITPEERKAYIGIYRLLYNIEKTDGAALGAVIQSGQEVTLNHLLKAVRTHQKGRIDAIINDEFGTLQGLSYEGETITNQLKAAFGDKKEYAQSHNTPDKITGNLSSMDEDSVAEQSNYMNRLLKEIKDTVSPEKLQKLQNNIMDSSEYQGEALTDSAPVYTGEPVIWKILKDIPAEQLYELLSQENSSSSADDAVYVEKVREFREICKNADQAIRFLNEFKLPSNSTNLLLASHILTNGETPVKKLMQMYHRKKTEKSENTLKETAELSDILIDKKSMADALEDLEQKAQAVLEQAMREETIDSVKLAERKSIAQQMSFLRTLAGKEFYRIPIETESGITNINLTIVRGTGSAGKVTVNVWSDTLGHMKSEISLKDEKINGYIACDNPGSLDVLQKNSEILEQAAKEEDITIQKLDYILQKKDMEETHYTYGKEDNTSTDLERKLYRLAKALVLTVRAAEKENMN